MEAIAVVKFQNTKLQISKLEFAICVRYLREKGSWTGAL
jgi:hypothetical protein